jgi:ParB-like chromosome segregation protein Spo0J
MKNVNELEFHPIANAFPFVDGQAFEELTADIERNGLVNPITLYEGKILDGRNRYLACKAAGTGLTEANLTRLPEDRDPIDFVASLNLHRRHLTASQLAAVAADLANLRHGGDRRSEEFKVSGETLKDDPLITQKVAAEKVGAALGSVKRAAAVKKADPEVFEEIKQGKISTGAAERKVKAKRAATATKRGGQHTPQAAKGDPKEKHARDVVQMNRAWNEVHKIFGDALLPAQKAFVQRLAEDLNATIHFAGEEFKPSKPGLNRPEARPVNHAGV